MAHRPLIPILISYITGLFVGQYLHLPSNPTLFLLGIVLIVSFVAIRFPWKRIAIIPLLGCFTLVGGLYMNSYTYPEIPPNHISNFLSENDLNIQGSLYKSPKFYEDRLKLYIHTERLYWDESCVETTGRILITVGDNETNLKYGDRVRFLCKLRRPRNFHNPGGFDYSKYLSFKGVLVTGYVKNGASVIRIGDGEGAFWRKGIEGLREKIRRFIDREPQLPNRGIIKALLLGEKGKIPEERKESFATAGVAHILAISGLHMGFIALVVFTVIRGILRFSERLMLVCDVNRVAAGATIFPVILYAFIAGFGVSTSRATIMIVTYLISVIIGRERDIYNTLALAALIITILFPTSIFDVSFQLSFVSVLSILYLTPRLLGYVSSIPGLPFWTANSIMKRTARYSGLLALISLAAAWGTGPILAYHFNRVVILGFIPNIVIVPVVGFLMIPISLVFAIMIFVSEPIASFLLLIESFMASFVAETVNLFSRIPGLSIWTTTPTLPEILLFYLFVAVLFNIGRFKGAGYIAVILCITITADACYWYYTGKNNHTLRVTFLDVGQGDAAVVEFPRSVRMLIDGGGFYNDSFDTGKNIVARFLWKSKIKRIDYIVLSHPHPDHLNGLRFIAKNFHVKEIWTNGQGIGMESYYELMDIIKDRGIKKSVMSAHTSSRSINGVNVDILNPQTVIFEEGDTEYHKALNNNSLVLKITMAEIKFLFTGDIGEETETFLIESNRGLESTVLKVPHHGSLTSSTKPFLSAVRPSYAIFSIGHKNRFGFPKEEILQRYSDMGIRTYRTDRDGAVTVETDGRNLVIRGELHSKGDSDIPACHQEYFLRGEAGPSLSERSLADVKRIKPLQESPPRLLW